MSTKIEYSGFTVTVEDGVMPTAQRIILMVDIISDNAEEDAHRVGNILLGVVSSLEDGTFEGNEEYEGGADLGVNDYRLDYPEEW